MGQASSKASNKLATNVIKKTAKALENGSKISIAATRKIQKQSYLGLQIYIFFVILVKVKFSEKFDRC